MEPGGQVTNGESCIVLHVSTGFVYAYCTLHIRVLLLHVCPPSGAHRFVAIRGAASWALRSMLQRLALNIPETMPATALGPIALCSLPSFNRLARARISSESRWDRRDNRAACLLRERERASERREKRSSPNLPRNLVAASTHWPTSTPPTMCPPIYFLLFFVVIHPELIHGVGTGGSPCLMQPSPVALRTYGVHGATICSLQYAVRLRL